MAKQRPVTKSPSFLQPPPKSCLIKETQLHECMPGSIWNCVTEHFTIQKPQPPDEFYAAQKRRWTIFRPYNCEMFSQVCVGRVA